VEETDRRPVEELDGVQVGGGVWAWCLGAGGRGEMRAVETTGGQWRQRWVGGDNTGWAAATHAFLSQSGCGSDVGGYARLDIQLTYNGLDPTVVSYLLFMSARTDRHKLPLIYVGQDPAVVN
jgi:hypothetical protein